MVLMEEQEITLITENLITKSKTITMKLLLKKYNIMSVAALASLSTNAEIIYTDVDPDLTFTENEESYQLDLNNDEVVDFTIVNYSFSFGFPGFFSINRFGVDIEMGNGNGVLGFLSNYTTSYGSMATNTLMTPVRANEIISSNQEFVSSSNPLFAFFDISYGGDSFTFTQGNFKDTIFDQFMGLKFNAGGQTLYGWARVSVKADENGQSFTVFDYAYEDSGAPIRAGEGIVSPGALSIYDNDLSKNINITYFDGQVNISSDMLIDGAISLIDISGKTLQTAQVQTTEFNMNANGLPSGIYIVQVAGENFIRTEKIII